MTVSTTLPPHIQKAASPIQTGNDTFALIGNPNTGKTSLFNALTGLRQKIGNYPGVTVEKKCGFFFSQHGKKLPLVDLPGSYSLLTNAPDETIFRDVLLGRIPEMEAPEKVVCVVDASNLRRSLYLLQLIAELGKPTVVALNMMDQAKQKGIKINIKALENYYGVPFIPCQANKGIGLMQLRLAMSRTDLPAPKPNLQLPDYIEQSVHQLSQALGSTAFPGEALIRLLLGPFEEDPEYIQNITLNQIEALQRKSPKWISELIQVRYQSIETSIDLSVKATTPNKKTFTEKVDSVVLHPLWGWVSLLAIMGTLFGAIFSLSSYPMQGLEWLIESTSTLTRNLLPESHLQSLVADGIIAGVGNVLLFLPQILLLFFFIGVLESSGYLTRAVFLLDRVMRRVGLQGKSFIPLLSSYACAVPGIMATRTLHSSKERLATVLVAPWMSCSARLPIYLLMITTMLPSRQSSPWLKAGILLGAYAAGTLAAFSIAWLLRKTLLKGPPSETVFELPPYHMPCWKNIFLSMYDKARLFVKKAGTFILGFSIIFWFLTAYPRNDALPKEERINHSYAAKLGHLIEPAIEPLGYDWKMGMCIISSFAARELFVGTMAITYNVDPSSYSPTDNDLLDHQEGERSTLSKALLAQKRLNGTPIYTTLTCLSLITFYIFALQCTSTLVMVRNETKSIRWPLFQFIYMTLTAYLAALAVYQGGTLLGF